MRFLGYEEMIVRLLESLYQETMNAVRADGGLTEWFITVIGVLQGCILSPLLFNIMLEFIIAFALSGCEMGVRVAGISISDLRFADDISLSLLAENTSELQELDDQLHGTSSIFGLQIKDTKTEVQCIRKDHHDLCIKLGNTKLQQNKEFVYLGGLISEDNGCDKDILRRIRLASSTVKNAKILSHIVQNNNTGDRTVQL